MKLFLFPRLPASMLVAVVVPLVYVSAIVFAEELCAEELRSARGNLTLGSISDVPGFGVRDQDSQVDVHAESCPRIADALPKMRLAFQTIDSDELLLEDLLANEPPVEALPAPALGEVPTTDEKQTIETSSPGDAKMPQSGAEGDRSKAGQRLRERLGALQRNPRGIRLGSPIAPDEVVPENVAATLMSQQPTQWVASRGQSIPIADRIHTVFRHQPLYFEELNLERCGRVNCSKMGCLQNAMSTLWFLTGTAILPYRLASQPHCQCVVAGPDCRCCQSFACPIEGLDVTCNDCGFCRGITAEAAAMAGFAFLLL